MMTATVTTQRKRRRDGSSLFCKKRQSHQARTATPRRRMAPLEAKRRAGSILSLLFSADVVRVPGPAHGGVIADEAFAVEIVEAIVHEHHAVLGRGLHGVFQKMELIFPDEIAHGVVDDEEFVSQQAARSPRKSR